MYTTSHVRAIGRIANEFRIIETDFPASYMLVLAYIARHEIERGEYPNSADIADHVGIARPSMSRRMRALGDQRLGARRATDEKPEGARPSLRLVEKMPDPVDLRMVRLRLTPKGRSLLTRIADILDTAKLK